MSESETKVEWYSCVADGRTIGLVGRRRLEGEKKRLNGLYGIEFRPATVEEIRKFKSKETV